MGRSVARVKGVGFILWHARHELYHVLLGLLWAWFLRERWNEFNPRWIWLAVIGSLLPDADHFWYFVTYGKKDVYTKTIKTFILKHEWRRLVLFMQNGHKYNTNLSTHNYYVMAIFLTISIFASVHEWHVGVILTGAMIIHYVFDVADDFFTFGRINPNWKRWGNGLK